MRTKQTPLEQLLSLVEKPSQEVDLRTFPSFDKLKRNFLSKLPKDCFQENAKNECWNWQGSLVSSKGYGRIKWERTAYRAHRISYMIFKGTIPAGEVVRHTCDNPSCVNPEHLILGSCYDNSIDMVKRNRQRSQILNEECVKVIKWMLKYRPATGLISKLARLHNVSPCTIGAIKAGRCWEFVRV